MGIWRTHFVHILQRNSPQDQPKPWLTTPSAARFQAASAREPFQWPATMHLQDLRALLARGKANPAPGPDNWEKWAVRRSGDAWLEVILTLANYIILNNYFPTTLKANYVIPIYKKGDVTEPSNYRGIVLANTLQIIVASWFTFRLSNYVWDHAFIPNTQIAAQRNTSVGDMTHLLSAMDGFAKIKGEMYLALKRDQKKGFDYIHHSAYEDAAHFFGLQHTLPFDHARTLQVQMFVKCRNMQAEPIYTDGQTKQGDPFSPLKYVLTTAMAFWWITDRHPELGFHFATTRSAHAAQDRDRPSTRYIPHQDADTDSFYMQAVAAMDDTILFARTEPQLQILTHDMEYFQNSYNMETDWTTPDKTTVFLMGRFTQADAARRICLTLPGDRQIDLPLSQERTFLKTPVNNPKIQADTITALVRGFVFPRPGLTLPMTALRKIAEVVLAGRIQARLQMHPIRPSAATALSTILNAKIKTYFRDLRYAKADVLIAPIASGGLQFPDLGRLNSTHAIASLHRNLNSMNPTIKRAFAIMHSEWQCAPHTRGGGDCIPPLTPSTMRGHNTRRNRNNFTTWEIAQQALEHLQYRIISSPLGGEGHNPDHNEIARTQRHFLAMAFDDPHLVGRAIDRMAREAQYGGQVLIEWATDGSAHPDESPGQGKASFAVTGPAPCTGKVKGHSVSILDAEIMALATAVNLDNTYRRVHSIDATVRSVVYTDQLRIVRLVQGADATQQQIKPGERSRHFLRYLLHLLATRKNLTLVHQKAHSDSEPHSRSRTLQKAADEAARVVRNKDDIPLYGPPVAYTDTYTLIDDATGPVHHQPMQHLNDQWNRVSSSQMRRSGNVYTYTQRKLFMHAQTAYSARVQHWTRSNALATPAWKSRHNLWRPDTCALCDKPSNEANTRHIFITCPGTQSLKAQSTKRAQALVVKAVQSAQSQQYHQALIDALFHDHPLWIDGEGLFWKGELPGHFKYISNLRPLYNDLAGLAMTTTAAIWSKHVQYDLKHRGAHTTQTHREPPQDVAVQTDTQPLPAEGFVQECARDTMARNIDPIHGFGNPDDIEIVGDVDPDNEQGDAQRPGIIDVSSSDSDSDSATSGTLEEEYWDEWDFEALY